MEYVYNWEFAQKHFNDSVVKKPSTVRVFQQQKDKQKVSPNYNLEALLAPSAPSAPLASVPISTQRDG